MESRLNTSDGSAAPLTEDDKQLAAAALLMEVAAADTVFDDSELQAFKQELEQTYQLTREEVNELQSRAENRQEDATSLFQFTQIVNDQCSREEKFALVKSMWTIALADGQLDKYEEHIIRRVAELVYLSHTDFLVARNAARSE
ncbi:MULTISPECIES: tellurite resistance TerB family protein [unclassified Gilvimarinus]|uniref:tellurite resistance TerB family protein n=1 Tax=unclassified Gilvimarinus TaxID=2642066 RepID=UPI0026E2EA8A|nr:MULTISPECIES: TerB family tellurite resistance protein [unclassified Gilvimarinus]MDO6570705.1 TerB family tellurite resistance protein [Gilvimarinus sp. 2_MG-2023]MDO6747702.1 TerB family tellurite resistance protein [Gilvimarinus sp. 1_MG-2023]